MDIVTVCYTPELHFLKLQARSMARHLESSGVGRIWVILNEADPRPAARYFDKHIAPEYGAHLDRVELLARDDVAEGLPDDRGARTQQVLKLRIADRVQQDSYLVLDAKNHFVRRVSAASFFDADSRYLGWRQNHRRAGRHGKLFRSTYAYFGLDPEPYIDSSPQTVTPLGIRTSRALSLLAEIRRREGCAFEQFFMEPGRMVTEFMLIQAWVLRIAGSYDADFCFGRRKFATFFAIGSEEAFAAKILDLTEGKILTMALHRQLLATLSDEHRAQVATVWQKSGLVTDEAEVEFFSRPFDPGSLAL